MFLDTPVRSALVVGSVVSGMSILFGLFGPEHAEELSKVLSNTAQSQMAQAGFFFTVAAWLHSGRVKKEIRANFESLTNAITSVADAFRADLKAHGQRLDNLAGRVQSLEIRTELKTEEETENL